VNELGQQTFIPWITYIMDSKTFLPLYDTLGYPSTKKEILPGLATRWEFSADFRTLTLFLQEGVYFHDGWGELTADDVKYSLEQYMSEVNPQTNAITYRNTIDSIEVIDPYTLVIHQKIASAALPLAMMEIENSNSSILCKKYLETVGIEEANLHPVGSGPYRLVEVRYGDYCKYEAFDEHWRVVPEFKYLIIRGVPEESTRVAMLTSGQIDATNISVLSTPEIPKEGFTIANWPGAANGFMFFGGMLMPEDDRYIEGYHGQDPWVDVRVREAMNIAIDREAINKAICLDTGTQITIPMQLPGWQDLEPYPFDPERAKQLLAEAGYPNGFSLDLMRMPAPGAPTFPTEVEAAAGYWEEIGIRVKIIPIEWPAWVPPTVMKGEDVGTVTTYVYGNLNLAEWFTRLAYFKPDGRWSFYQDAETWRLADKISAEVDLEKQEPIYKELSKHLRDNYCFVPFFVGAKIVVSNSQKVGEWPPNWGTYYFNFEYIRHAQPLNTWRLFTP
ncbi:ABC transporter substrate-binding protein, partial [Chloroflexota bacterium]